MKYLPFSLCLALCALAQDAPKPQPLLVQDPQMTAWMKGMNTAQEVLKKAEKKSGKQVVSAAETLGGIYENMIGYWRQQGAADAVKVSEQGKALAATLASAAVAEKSEEAAGAAAGIDKTCSACHRVYRTRLADGTYRIRIPAELVPPPAAAPAKPRS